MFAETCRVVVEEAQVSNAFCKVICGGAEFWVTVPQVIVEQPLDVLVTVTQ